MAISSINEMFMYDLSTIYSAEQILNQGMQSMRSMAQNEQVKQMIDNHLSEFQQQMRNLQQAFQVLGQQPLNVTCHAAEGLMDDFKMTSSQVQNTNLVDLAILASWTKAEYLEIASYRSLVQRAKLMGNTQLSQPLLQILIDEERSAKLAEQLYVQLAKQMIGQGGTAMGKAA